MKLADKIKLRRKYNFKILLHLSWLSFKYPELRFGQILGLALLNTDIYYDESVDLYERIKEIEE